MQEQLTRIAKISLGAARHVGSGAAAVASRVAREVSRRRSGGMSPSTPPSAQTAPDAAPPAPPPAPATARSAPPPASDPETEHVDREAVLVAEYADPGAEDGPGASLHVEEPWDGYGEQTAKDVIARLADESPATLAVARLYEASHRDRVTVLDEIDRRLEAAGG
jgi:hypothetical protein